MRTAALVGLISNARPSALPALAAAPNPSIRSDPAYVIDTWDTDQGLPDNSETAIVQTADGYLWCGSSMGWCGSMA